MKNLIAAAIAAVAAAGASFASDHGDILVIEVAGQSSGLVEIELFPDVAPKHVERIKQLAVAGEYDGVVFHRVIEGFMAQTGDVEFGDWTNSGVDSRVGTGGSAEADLPAEFSQIPFTKGVVGMARSQNPDSANSQFFIMFGDAPHLTGNYTVVGRVISGQDIVDAIKKGNPGANGMIARDPDYMARVEVKSGG